MNSYNGIMQTMVVCILVAILTGCGSTDSDPSSEFDVQLSSISSHGDVLADREGHLLYIFTPDVKGEIPAAPGYDSENNGGNGDPDPGY